MIYRCYKVPIDSDKWHFYRGKGITVCDTWLRSKEAFIEWAIGHGWKKGLTIDRIDSSKGYSPDNCQWITRRENTIKAARQRKENRKNNILPPGRARWLKAYFDEKINSLGGETMSNAQKELMTKFSATLGKLSEKDQAYLLGRAEGMAEANELHNNVQQAKESK